MEARAGSLRSPMADITAGSNGLAALAIDGLPSKCGVETSGQSESRGSSHCMNQLSSGSHTVNIWNCIIFEIGDAAARAGP